MATYTMGRIITFPNPFCWKDAGFVAENTWKATGFWPVPRLQFSCHFSSWYLICTVQNALFLVQLRAAKGALAVGLLPAPPQAFLPPVVILLLVQAISSFSALSRSSTCKYIRNAILFRSRITFVSQPLHKAEKSSPTCVWPLNYATSKPQKLNRHFLPSFLFLFLILARFPSCSEQAMSLCMARPSAGGIKKHNRKQGTRLEVADLITADLVLFFFQFISVYRA